MGKQYWVRWIDDLGEPWFIAEVDDKGSWVTENTGGSTLYPMTRPPGIIGPRVYPPGHPETPPACDLPAVLDLVAAYIAPSQPISYGRFVELLCAIKGCEGYSYSDLYPRLFNVQANANPYPGDMAIVYDCEQAATQLRDEQELPQPRTVPDLFNHVLAQLTKADQRQLADLMGPKAWGIVTAAEKAPNDAEAMTLLADLSSTLEDLDPEHLEALGCGLAQLFDERGIYEAPRLLQVIHRASLRSSLERPKEKASDVH